MKCSQISKHFADYMTGDLKPKVKEEMEAHLCQCSSCKEELTSLSNIWHKLDGLPEEQPSEALRARFYSMLEGFKEGQQRAKFKENWVQSLLNWLDHFKPRRPAMQLGFAVLLLIVGLFVGYQIQPQNRGNQELVELRQEVESLSKLVTMSLLKQQSPSERLRGVNYSYYFSEPDQEVLSALLNTLKYDSNMNVRLAALEALSLFDDSKMVGNGLLESLTLQSSPLVQIALIDHFVKVKERQSLKVLNQFVEDAKLHQAVKNRAQRAIEQLQ